MSEGFFPVALHQDPRYFVMGTGGFWKRTGYAMSREVITRRDDSRNHFNTSELAGKCCGRRHLQPPLSGGESIIWKYRKQVGTTNSPGYLLQCGKRVLARRAQQNV